MKPKIRATWVSRRERSIWCLDFAGFESDPQGLAAEIEASARVIRQQVEDSLLVALYLHHPNMTPELVAFLKTISNPMKNPIHKMAIIGVGALDRIWLERIKGISFPKNAAFFGDYEKAKDWLVSERF